VCKPNQRCTSIEYFFNNLYFRSGISNLTHVVRSIAQHSSCWAMFSCLIEAGHPTLKPNGKVY